jgi:pyruvate dehydrogenase (quinone)
MRCAEMATVDFVHVRNEEYGVFAAVAEAYFAGEPVAVCGTAGPGVVHLFNGLMDARKERAPVIAIAGDVETRVMDTSSLEEMNPYQFFQAASLYTARLINPAQAQSVIGLAIRTSIIEKGPTVVSIPGDVAAADAVGEPTAISIPAPPVFRPSNSDLSRLIEMINEAGTVAMFGGDGCRDARDEVVELAARLKARPSASHCAVNNGWSVTIHMRSD